MRRLIALVFAALLAATPFAQAAVTANSFITPQTPQGYTPAQIVNGTASLIVSPCPSTRRWWQNSFANLDVRAGDFVINGFA